MQVCKSCREEKPRESFYKDPRHSTGLHQRCSECEKSEALARYHANPVHHQKKTQAWRKANPERVAGSQRKLALKRYGLSEGDFDRLLRAQSFVCAICGTDQPGGIRKRFHVDHNHATGKVRGLLCGKCNLGLGLFNDSLDLLEKAAAYIALDGEQPK